MNRSKLARLACLPLAIAMVASSGLAAAVVRGVNSTANASGVCQSALPAFDGLIRKRPLAIQNEGSSDAFVTCAFTLPGAGSTATSAYIYAKSNDGLEHTVSCTGVTGFATGNNQAVVKTTVLPANGSQGYVGWIATDFTGVTSNFPSPFFSVSCLLPPGTGLNDTYLQSTIDVGT